MNSKRVLLTSALLGLASPACSNDDKQSTDDARTLGALSSVQTTDVCAYARPRIERINRAYITVACTDIATLEDSVAACDRERSGCIADPPEDATLDDLALDCTPGSKLSITEECPDLTVSQLEGCLEQTAKSLEDLVDVYSCESADDDAGEAALPYACLGLEQICPRLAEFTEL